MMIEKKKTPIQKAQEEVQRSIDETNKMIVELGVHTKDMNDTLLEVHARFQLIRNSKNEYKRTLEQVDEIRSGWKQQAEIIEKEYKKNCQKSIRAGIIGAEVGTAIVSMGPTAAMGIASTVGVASTGTAISNLSGAAATNAALAWLGGGALSVGGGGMAAGNALLSLAGPVGWSIAGVSLLVNALTLIVSASNRKRMESIISLMCKRDVKTYQLAILEIKQRIAMLDKDLISFQKMLTKLDSFGTDYSAMTEEQQYELGACVNMALASAKLLTDPIKALERKYTETDYERYISVMHSEDDVEEILKTTNVIVFIANMIYNIKMDEKDYRLLGESIKSNKELLKTLKTTKKSFQVEYVTLAKDALEFKFLVH